MLLSRMLTSDDSLRDLMSRRGWSVTETAEKLNISRQALHKLLNGGKPSLATAIRISEVFGIPLEDVARTVVGDADA
jgi:transcriptional regulator with XRE-family HTH domain